MEKPQNMISAMIVDDEEKSRYGLSELLAFAKYNVRIDSYAANGQEALEIIGRTLPDLVLTDVKMPVMDGIALAEAIMSRYPDIRVVFISGYDDLAFIKAAFRLDVFDYLIKPVDLEEFDDVMRRITQRIQNSRKQSRQLEATRRQLDDSIPDLIDMYHRDLLLSDGDAPLPIPPLLKGSVSADGPYTVLLLLPESGQEGSRPPAIAAIVDFCKRLLPGAVVTRPAPDEIVILLSGASSQDSAYAHAVRLQSVLLDVLAQETVICVGTPVQSLFDISRSYQNARDARQARLLGGGSHILLYEETSADQVAPALNDMDEASLRKALEDGDGDLLRDRLSALFEKTIRTGITLAQCRLFALRVLFCLRSILREHGVSPGDTSLDPKRMQERIAQLGAQEAILAYIQKAAKAMLADYVAATEEEVNLSVRRMQKYIRTHYADTITLQDVAEKVYLAVPYACTLFKRETGMTIKEYVVQQRILKAKELLISTNDKLYMISQAVGYSDQAYFARQFRKLCGIGPVEFRNRKGQ